MSYSQQATTRISSSAFAWFLTIIFLILALGISGGGYFYYLGVKKVLKDRAYRQLSAVADLKAGQIDGWRKDMRHDAEVLRSNSFLIEHIEDQVGPWTLDYLSTIREQYGYRSISLLDLEGRIIIATSSEPTDENQKGAQLARQAALSGRVVLSDFYKVKPGMGSNPANIQLVLAVPLILKRNHTAHITGVILISIDPGAFIYPLIQTWPGASPTAETLLIRREGDEVVFLNELRHRQGTALNLRYAVSQANLPAAMAVSGVEGIVEGMDYRSIPVLAAIRKIPDSPWFMVSKVDMGEVYAPLTERVRMVALVAVLLIIGAGGTVLVFWYRREAEFTRRQLATENERDALAGKYDLLSRYANDVILLSDEERFIQEANEKTLGVYGYTREELLGMHLDDLESQERHGNFAAHFATLESKDGVLFEAEHQNRQGDRFWVEVSSRAVETTEGRFQQSIIRDISDRKAVEAAQRKLNAELEQRVQERTAELRRQKDLLQMANRELEAFAYSVSHDLRSPLRGIDGYSKILLEEYKEQMDDDGRFVLSQVRASAQEMDELIDDLLEYSRLGRCELRRTTVDLNHMVKEILEEIRRAAPHRRLRLDMGLLPTVQADALLLRGVIRNLLDNAVKFTASRDPGIITVGTLDGQEWPVTITFFVRDNGVGFDMRYADKLFGVFQRLHSQDQFQGTGVGLANVKRIIERHGGRVWAEAQPDAGSIFYFTLPAETTQGLADQAVDVNMTNGTL